MVRPEIIHFLRVVRYQALTHGQGLLQASHERTALSETLASDASASGGVTLQLSAKLHVRGVARDCTIVELRKSSATIDLVADGRERLEFGALVVLSVAVDDTAPRIGLPALVSRTAATPRLRFIGPPVVIDGNAARSHVPVRIKARRNRRRGQRLRIQ